MRACVCDLCACVRACVRACVCVCVCVSCLSVCLSVCRLVNTSVGLTVCIMRLFLSDGVIVCSKTVSETVMKTGGNLWRLF